MAPPVQYSITMYSLLRAGFSYAAYTRTMCGWSSSRCIVISRCSSAMLVPPLTCTVLIAYRTSESRRGTANTSPKPPRPIFTARWKS